MQVEPRPCFTHPGVTKDVALDVEAGPRVAYQYGASSCLMRNEGSVMATVESEG